FNRRSDLEAVNRVAVFFLLGIQNTETVVSCCISFINFKYSQKCFFGAKQTVFTHALVGNIPKLTQAVANFTRNVSEFIPVNPEVAIGQNPEACDNCQLKHLET